MTALRESGNYYLKVAYRVFIADDSPSVLKAIHMAFQDSGYDLYTSQDGDEVMGLIQQITPDAIVLGLSLPNRDGYVLVQELNSFESFQETPIILLLNAFEGADENKLEQLEYAELVQKPFDSEDLAHKIRALIGGTREIDSLPEEPDEVKSPEAGTEEKGDSSANTTELDTKIKEQIRQEVLDMERELEKRVKARISREIKTWLRER